MGPDRRQVDDREPDARDGEPRVGERGAGVSVRRCAPRSLDRRIEACGPPQFVIADSNWGSGADTAFLVIAPDPATGEPLLWTKTIPPGTRRRATRTWVDHEWAMID